MAEIINEMQHSLEMAGGSVGLTALLLAGILALWYNKHESRIEVNCLFIYALITLIAVISPVYIKLITDYFPSLYKNNIYLWILPIVPVILYPGVIGTVSLKTLRKKLVFGIGLIAILILAAATSYSQSSVNVTDKTYIENKRKDLFNYISRTMQSEDDRVLIWGDRDVMEDARIYDGRINTLYGKTLWENYEVDSDLGFDSSDFEEAMYGYEYELMENPAVNIETISKRAYAYGCNYIIIPENEFFEANIPVPEVVGNYYLEYTDNTYLLYIPINPGSI